MLSTVCIDPVTDSLKRFWELESIGVVDKGEAHMSLKEEDFIRQFTEGLEFDGERYKVPLLWKRDAPQLKSNYVQAVKRLESVEKPAQKESRKSQCLQEFRKPICRKGVRRRDWGVRGE